MEEFLGWLALFCILGCGVAREYGRIDGFNRSKVGAPSAFKVIPFRWFYNDGKIHGEVQRTFRDRRDFENRYTR